MRLGLHLLGQVVDVSLEGQDFLDEALFLLLQLLELLMEASHVPLNVLCLQVELTVFHRQSLYSLVQLLDFHMGVPVVS